MLKIIDKVEESSLTQHLKMVDNTGCIKFTHETEDQGKIPFLDTLIVRRDDGRVTIQVYRKPTHTNQYFSYDVANPLVHKLNWSDRHTL